MNRLNGLELLGVSSIMGFFYGIGVYIAIMFILSFCIPIENIDENTQGIILFLCVVLSTASTFYYYRFIKK